MPQEYEAREPVKIAKDAPWLAIGIPTRGLSPLEFWMCVLQAQQPMGLGMSFIFQKNKLPAEARNLIVARCLERGYRYLLLLDDDVLFPPMSFYRLWSHMAQHPEAAAITGVVPVKCDPPEPMLYARENEGAAWDWALGDLVPVRGAGAGIVLVNLEYVRKLTPPYFQDAQTAIQGAVTMRGHDRYFFDQLQDKAGGVVYADTGLLCGHFDHQLQKAFVLPPTAPCFQRPLAGEAWVPAVNGDGVMQWSRLIRREGPQLFVDYLDWLATKEPEVRELIPGERTPAQMLGYPEVAA